MEKKSAFTLVEVLISIAISSFIILSMIQVYRNVVNSIARSDESMVLNRQVCLLFNQMEKDISPAYIPSLQQEIKQEKKAEDKKTDEKEPEKKAEDKDEKKEPEKKEEKKAEDKNKKELKSPFEGQIYEDEYRRIDREKWELFKKINFITTNSLHVYGKRYVRLVRVSYELAKDKEKSTAEKNIYKLFRYETTDLYNYKFLDPAEDLSKKEKQQQAVKKILVAENIKDFYIKYWVKVEPDEKEPKYLQQQEEQSSFIWPAKKIKKDIPDKVGIYVVFWDDKLVNSNSFECLIPLFLSLGKAKEEETKTEEKKDEKKDEKTTEQPAQQPASPPVSA